MWKTVKNKCITSSPIVILTQWLNWNVSKSLDIVAQRILTQILDWREAKPATKQEPTIFSQDILPLISWRAPRNMENSAKSIISQRVLKRYGSALLECVGKESQVMKHIP